MPVVLNRILPAGTLSNRTMNSIEIGVLIGGVALMALRRDANYRRLPGGEQGVMFVVIMAPSTLLAHLAQGMY